MSDDALPGVSETDGPLSGAEYRTVFHLVNDAIFVHDADTGAILDVNETMCEMYGYTPEEARSLTVGDLSAGYLPYTEETAIERMRAAVRGQPQVFEWHARDSNGELFWVEVSLRHAAIEGEGRILVIVRDIDDRKERQRRLRYYEAAVEKSDDLVAAVNADREYLFVNDAWRQFHDWAPDDVVGREVADVLGADVYEQIDEPLQRALDGATVTFDLTVDDPGHRASHFEVEYYPIGSGKDRAVAAIMSDVSDRVSRERELREERERLSLALETANAGTWEWRPDSDEATWDENLERLYGIGTGTFEGTFDAFVERVHPDDRDAVEAAVRRALERDGTFEQEFRIVRDDGVERWLASRGKLIEDGSDTVRMIGVEIDVTERKERERHLRVVDRVLRHNLRNDVTVIRGFASNIQRTTTGQTSADADRIVEKSDQLLETAEKEREIVSILLKRRRSTTLDASRAVLQTVDEMQRRYPDASFDLELSPSTSVDALNGISRAIRELVENAIVHDDDTPEVRIELEPEAEFVRLRIADTGPGIPEMERRVLAGEREIQPLYHGSGLGLWLVNWFVRLSDGTIELGENEPRGTVVTIRLPKAETE
jgi:PAS domain S-box-containing protein